MAFYPPNSEGGLLYKVVDVSSAQLLNMFSSPVELIGSPGSGKCISVDKIIFMYTYGTTPYTQPGFTNAVMNGNNIVQFGNILNLPVNRIQQAVPTSVILSANSGLYLTNTVGNPVGGDGLVRLFIYYNVNNLT